MTINTIEAQPAQCAKKEAAIKVREAAKTLQEAANVCAEQRLFGSFGAIQGFACDVRVYESAPNVYY